MATSTTNKKKEKDFQKEKLSEKEVVAEFTKAITSGSTNIEVFQDEKGKFSINASAH